ncbi:MAG TPA: DUF4147 domain-containing protein, partial [Edaphobacter sp.]|nr:DUF4147 domain-containing protein [Edaphobacter sp.]
MTTPREDIRDIFECAFRNSRVEQAIEERVRFDGETMTVDGFRYELAKFSRWIVIAIGKAAAPMLSSFLSRSGDVAQRFEGVIAAPDPVVVPSEHFVAFHAGHPSPNAASVAAAEKILQTLAELTEHDLVVFLISGGGSSL